MSVKINLDEIKRINAEQAQKFAAVGAVAAEALVHPLPGPTEDVFAAGPEITVGRWQVRPFYDMDFALLHQLRHPVSAYMRAVMAGAPLPEEWSPTGPEAWALFWIMTRPPEEAEAGVTGNALKPEAAAAAKAEFGRLRFWAAVKLYEAVAKQVVVYASAGVAYGPPEEEGKPESPAPNS